MAALLLAASPAGDPARLPQPRLDRGVRPAPGFACVKKRPEAEYGLAPGEIRSEASFGLKQEPSLHHDDSSRDGCSLARPVGTGRLIDIGGNEPLRARIGGVAWRRR